MLNVISESPVADGRGGFASAFSSSSESSITLRRVMPESEVKRLMLPQCTTHVLSVRWAMRRDASEPRYAQSRVTCYR